MVNPGQIFVSLLISAFGFNILGVVSKLLLILIKVESNSIFIITHCFSYGFFPNITELIPLSFVFLPTNKPNFEISKMTFDLVTVLLFFGFFDDKIANLLPVFLIAGFNFILCNKKSEILHQNQFYEKVLEENHAYSSRLENFSKRKGSSSDLRRSSTILRKLKSIRSMSGQYSFTEGSDRESPKSSKSNFESNKSSLESDEDSPTGSISSKFQEPQIIPGLNNEEIKEILNALITQEYLILNPDKSAENEVDLLAIALEAQNIFTQKIENLPGSSRKTMKLPARPQLRHIRSMMEVSEPLTEVLESIGDWDFNCFDLLKITKEPAFEVGLYIFNTLGLCDRFSIDNQTIRKFLSIVDHSYNKNNFYHNSLHAADVTASTLFLIQKGLSRCGNLVDLDVFALIFAAICHDIAHPGFNNSFLVATGHELALRYNDQSCLENMHANKAFSIIQAEGCRITSKMAKADFQRFRKSAVAAILSTDLQVHFPKLHEFKANLDKKLDISDDKFRALAIQICLKCADIGHGAKKLEIHIDWTNLITKEFFNQGDKEKAANLNVSPLCDRENCIVSKSQIGFLEVLVRPLFKVWEEFIEANNEQDEDLEIKVCVGNINENIEFWNEEFENKQQGKPCFEIDAAGPPLE